MDALLIINELNRPSVTDSIGRLPTFRGASDYYFDVNGDGFAVPFDALQVLNYLNRQPLAATAARSRESAASPIGDLAPVTVPNATDAIASFATAVQQPLRRSANTNRLAAVKLDLTSDGLPRPRRIIAF